MTAAPAGGDPDEAAGLPRDVDVDAAARGALYGLLATAFEPPDASFHAALADGSFEATVEQLLALTSLDVEPTAFPAVDDPDELSVRYHDLFVVGFAQYADRTDGSLAAAGPPVPLHESAYRTDAAWGDVNLDLARAYDHFGLEVDPTNRDHHDGLRLQLEFAGYLARREAAVDASAAAARLDLLDRHLRVLVESVRDRLREASASGAYAAVVALLDGFSAADREDLETHPGADG